MIVVDIFVVDWVVKMAVKIDVEPKVVVLGRVVESELVIMDVVGTPVVVSVALVVTKIVAVT